MKVPFARNSFAEKAVLHPVGGVGFLDCKGFRNAPVWAKFCLKYGLSLPMHTRNYHHLIRSWIIGVAAICLGTALSAASPAENVPLPEEVFPQLKPLLKQALSQSSTMLARNIDIAAAEANQIMANSARLPYVGASVSYSQISSAVSGNVSTKSKADGVFYSFSASQPVYTWGAVKAAADSAKIGVLIAEKSYADAYRLLALSIRGQFMGLVVKKVGLRNAEFAHKLAATNLALEEEKLRNGRLSQGDIIQPRLALDEATLARDRAEQELTQAIRSFCRQAGLAGLEVSQIPDDITLGGQYYGTSYAEPMLAKFIGAGVEDTYQAQIYRDYIGQADLTYRIAKVRLYPKFYLNAAFSQSNQTTAVPNFISQVAVDTTTASLTANWNLFDGLATKGAKLSALATKHTYERILENYLSTATQQARDLERSLNFSSRAMQLADTRRYLQTSAVQMTSQNLARGASTQANVDGATYALYQSELAAIVARADFLNKWVEFLSALNLDPVLENLPAKYRTNAK
ncbi:MAG: TolC family protein [Opitutae bacterium]